MNPLQKKRSILGLKLKNVLADLSVDIFGYEKQVTQTLSSRMGYISKQLEIPEDALSLRIFQKEHVIKAFLYVQNTPLTDIPTGQLTHFFMPEALADMAIYQNRAAFSIKQYLKEFSETHHMATDSACIWIQVKDSRVEVSAFQDEDFITHLPLQTLIKYFK